MPDARLVQVAVPAPLLAPLTYSVPDHLAARVVPGARVRVPLGRRRVVGLVLGEAEAAPAEVEIRAIEYALDPEGQPALPPDVLEIARWTIEYYLAPPGDVARAVLPAALSPSREGWVVLTDAGRQAARVPGAVAALGWLASRPGGRARPRAVQERLGRAGVLGELIEAGLVAPIDEDERARGAPVQRRVVLPAPHVQADLEAALATLARAPARRTALAAAVAEPGQTIADLARSAGVGAEPLRRLLADGLLVERLEDVAPPALPGVDLPVSRPLALTEAQERAVAHLAAKVAEGAFHQAVLYGVTGSGKTEVYLRVAERTLALSRSVLFLVPEIGLAPQAKAALEARFGEQVVVLHSGMSDRQRHEAWHRAREGRARVVVGARSALFAPLDRPGLIVVDEEHDGGYKQEESPRYHARDLAVVRARVANAVIVMGSATPSLECWSRAQEGRAALLELPDRVGAARLATVEMVDMRDEFRETKRDDAVSRRLLAEIEGALGREEQSIVLLNRRGYTRVLLCRMCGEGVSCAQCSIPLTYHKDGDVLRCHYCGFARRRPARCPACDSEHLHDLGYGTQRVEEDLQAALPSARIARLDRDTARSPERLATVIRRFARGQIDVLIGTQMVAKGHHFPRVTVVGVLSADASLWLPDFRAAERTFALLTQVAGRAGRGERPGRVVVQAYRPDHPAILAAAVQDYRAFAEREMSARRALRYPPAAAMANLLVRDEEQPRALERAQALRDAIHAAGEGKVAVLGPVTAPLARLRGEWRVQIIVRALKRKRLAMALAEGLAAAIGEQGVMPRWLVVDVDPLQLL